MKTNLIQSAIIAITAAAFAFFGTAPQADARTSVHVHVGGGYRPAHHSYHSGRYLIGYDRCGRPVWGYRSVRKCYPVYRPCPPRPVYRPVYRPACRPRPVPYRR